MATEQWTAPRRVGGVGWRVLVVAAGFFGAQVGSAGVLVSLGLLAVPADVAPTLWPFAVAGLLVGVVLGPLARVVPGSRRWHVVVWGSLLALNGVGVLLEGAFFAPDLAPVGNLPAGVVSQVTTAVATAGLVAWLFVPRDATGRPALRDRPWSQLLARVGAGAGAYVVLFLVVGALNYLFVTRPYYEAAFAGLTTPSMGVVVVLEAVRGVLIAASVVPFVRSAPWSRRRVAVAAGLLAFLGSGLVPLVYQAATLPAFLLFASGYEILLQAGPAGALVGWLLWPGERS
ncbi:hypothetical protein ACFQH6_02505 [Halobacteriaceae archaeon GCM10025711]